MIMLSFLMFCFMLLNKIKKKNLTLVFAWVWMAISLLLALVNLVLYLHYNWTDQFIYHPTLMICEITKYSRSRSTSFVIALFPVIFVISFSAYTIMKLTNYLRDYPEIATNLLITEVKLYPFLIFVCYLPKFIKHSMKFSDY